MSEEKDAVDSDNEKERRVISCVINLEDEGGNMSQVFHKEMKVYWDGEDAKIWEDLHGIDMGRDISEMLLSELFEEMEKCMDDIAQEMSEVL